MKSWTQKPVAKEPQSEWADYSGEGEGGDGVG